MTEDTKDNDTHHWDYRAVKRYDGGILSPVYGAIGVDP